MSNHLIHSLVFCFLNLGCFIIIRGFLGCFFVGFCLFVLLFKIMLLFFFFFFCNTVNIGGPVVLYVTVQFSSVQDGIYALGKGHNYALHPVSQTCPKRCL